MELGHTPGSIGTGRGLRIQRSPAQCPQAEPPLETWARVECSCTEAKSKIQMRYGFLGVLGDFVVASTQTLAGTDRLLGLRSKVVGGRLEFVRALLKLQLS